MAEVLAVVASGMSVVSLAIQVAENLEKLKRFWELIEAAPEEVRLAIEEVEILSLVLKDIDRGVQQQLLLSPAIKVAVMKSLRLCRSCGDALGALAKEMENSIVFSKRRGVLKVALKQEKMNIFKRKLENAKTTFLLAHHCYSHAIQQQQWESHERDMAEMRAVLSGLQKPSSETAVLVGSEANLCEEGESDIEDVMDSRDANTGPPQLLVSSSQVVRFSGKDVVEVQSGSRSILGVIDLVREKRRDGTTTTSLCVDFPEWIFARRFEIRLRNSYRGWDQSFRSYRISDYDSDVFKYSMTGDIEGLQHLFDTGKASPFEVDPEGRTPLHYAAICARAATCRFLLENGADANLRTSWEGNFDSDAGTIYRERVEAAATRSISAWSLPISSYSTPLHLLASVSKDYIEISKDARKGSEEAQRLIGTGRSIEMEIQATAEALVSFGQTDLFHKDQLGNTVYHILDGSTTTWRWLRQQGDIQLANLKADETCDILLTRCIGLRDHDKNSLQGILPEGDKLRQLAGPASQSRLAELMLPLICASLTFRALLDDNFVLIPEVQRHSIVPELVAAGSNIHNPDLGSLKKATLLTTVLRMGLDTDPQCNPPWMSRKGIPRCVTLGLLCPLEAAGVDLVAYGEEERAMYQRGQSSWTIHITSEDEAPQIPYDLTYEILDIRPAALPQDFGIEWEDLYVSSALAEDFWRLVEGDDCLTVAMPGGWVD